MVAEYMFISEERESIIDEQYFNKKQGPNILNIISGNLEITMNKIKNLKQKIREVKSTLDFTEDVLQKKVEKLEENMKYVDTRIRDIYK